MNDKFCPLYPGVRNTDFGDVVERKDLRTNLKCNSFRWYLENVYPESHMPLEYFSLGEVSWAGDLLIIWEKCLCKAVLVLEFINLVLVGIVHNCPHAFFQIQHSDSGRCLDSMGRKNGEKVGIVNCHGMGGNQVNLFLNSIEEKRNIFIMYYKYHIFSCLHRYFLTRRRKKS